MSDPLALTSSPAWAPGAAVDARGLRALLDGVEPFTVGLEEELMLLDAGTFELAPACDRALAAVGGDPRFCTELRTAQVEIVTPVCRSVAEAAAEVGSARALLGERLEPGLGFAAAGTHPFSTDWGEVTEGDRYRLIADEYTWVVRRSQACGLHVHVAVGGAERTLAVYNALRSYLPELAALSANSPFHEGHDTGLCSIRPKLNEAFPRSGVPPAFASWEELVGFVEWGRRGGLFPDASHFWWDLRLHPEHGTVELRVADAQTRLEDVAGVAAVFHSLSAWLAGRHDAGEALPVHPGYRIVENAWRGLRYGVRGWLVDLDTGEPAPARERIAALLDELEPVAADLGCADELVGARTLLAGNGADRQRYVAEREDDLRGLVRWLAAESSA